MYHRVPSGTTESTDLYHTAGSRCRTRCSVSDTVSHRASAQPSQQFLLQQHGRGRGAQTSHRTKIGRRAKREAQKKASKVLQRSQSRYFVRLCSQNDVENSEHAKRLSCKTCANSGVKRHLHLGLRYGLVRIYGYILEPFLLFQLQDHWPAQFTLLQHDVVTIPAVTRCPPV